ncbi:uncharacterized protein LOC130281870 isoform X2 [Hyla sarda]|uniref:uncharacterized protein LOC130281870 isoform X2 n=1 Tax=Hyla sarda TaxID=327740 RepID=UPI0024C27074|nr:uncharacterized protein LOC130281870 isoform X2 [Hyla sarda]
MKIFILLALVGVSVCNDYGGNYQPPIMCGPGGYGSSGQGGGSWQSGNGGGRFSGHSQELSVHGGGGSADHSGELSVHGGGGSSGHSGELSGHGGGGSWSSWSSWSSSSSSSSSFQCDSKYKNDFANDDKCLKHALENVDNLGKVGQKIICKVKEHKENMTKEYFNELKDELGNFVGCTGCGVGHVIGLQKPLGELGFGVGTTGSELVEAVEKLADNLGLVKPVLNILCPMLGPLFASECVKKLIGNDVSAVTENVKNLLCKKEEDLDVKLTIGLLKNVGCLLDDGLGTDDTLEDLTEDVGEAVAPAVKGVVRTMKDNHLTGSVVNVLCPVGKLVDDIVNGGDSSPLDLGGLLGGGDDDDDGGLLDNLLGGGGNGGGLLGGGGNGGGLLGSIGRRR